MQAMREGHWLILDELNLAPTDVLEALNRVRIIIYIINYEQFIVGYASDIKGLTLYKETVPYYIGRI